MTIRIPHPEFLELAPRPRTRFIDGPVELALYGRLPPRPDDVRRSYAGSSAGLTADSGELSAGDLTAERLARDAARQAGEAELGEGMKSPGRGSAGARPREPGRRPDPFIRLNPRAMSAQDRNVTRRGFWE
jgi:hypothetical protein